MKTSWLSLVVVGSPSKGAVDTFWSQRRLCVDTGQTGGVDRSDICRREIPAVDLRTSPGQDPVGETHVGLL
jgi:hypothetical protein